MIRVFEFIAQGRRNGEINEDELSNLLGERYKTKFWWPTKEEQEEWIEKWEATPVEARHTDPSLETPWDFSSWVDAFYTAEIELKKIVINNNGEGIIIFEQLAYPSGGIEATEEIVKIYDGQIISNDAI